MIDTQKFAERLKQARIDAGMNSQKELAEAAGIATQTISLYSKGATVPSIENLVKLSQTLHVSCDWLLGQTDASSTAFRLESYGDAVRVLEAIADRFGILIDGVFTAEIESAIEGNAVNTYSVTAEGMKLENTALIQRTTEKPKTQTYKEMFMMLRHDAELQRYFDGSRKMSALVAEHIITPAMRDSWWQGEIVRLDKIMIQKEEG